MRYERVNLSHMKLFGNGTQYYVRDDLKLNLLQKKSRNKCMFDSGLSITATSSLFIKSPALKLFIKLT